MEGQVVPDARGGDPTAGDAAAFVDDGFIVPADALDDLDAGVLLRCAHPSGGELFIFGTAHVSEQSALDVRRAVHIVKPDCLLVELCRARAGLLMQRPARDTPPPELSWADVTRTLKEQQGLSGVFQLLLAHMYASLSRKLKVMPGAEFLAAMDGVRDNQRSCDIVLGDRDLSVTISRAWALLPFTEKLQVVWQLLRSFNMDVSAEQIEQMKNSDVLEGLMVEFGATLPTLMRVLLTERDLYLARSILQCRGNRIFAVVGLGHARGIQDTLQRWQAGESSPDADCRDLCYIPPTWWTPRRLALLALGTGVVAVVGGFFAVRTVWRWVM